MGSEAGFKLEITFHPEERLTLKVSANPLIYRDCYQKRKNTEVFLNANLWK